MRRPKRQATKEPPAKPVKTGKAPPKKRVALVMSSSSFEARPDAEALLEHLVKGFKGVTHLLVVEGRGPVQAVRSVATNLGIEWVTYADGGERSDELELNRRVIEHEKPNLSMLFLTGSFKADPLMAHLSRRAARVADLRCVYWPKKLGGMS